MNNEFIPYKKYSKTLPIAEELYKVLFGKPQSHKEWADKFNKVGDINKVLIQVT